MSKFHNFVTSREDLENELEIRKEFSKKGFAYGVPFLNACLTAMYPGEITLVGARSGAGKTEIATLIAEAVIAQGGRVAFFALEAERRENSARRLYRRLSRRFFDDPNRTKGVSINYHDWRYGKLDDVFDPYYREELAKIIASDKDNYWIRYRESGDYTIDTFQKEIASLKGFSAVFLDHFHFFDLDPGPENESQKRIAKQIRDIAAEYQIPIVLVAHLRKTDKRFSSPIPDMEEFMGSSDVYKVAHKVCLLAPGPRVDSEPGSNLWTTYFNIAKVRTDGSRARYSAKTIFDVAKTSYLENFKLGEFVREERGYVWRDLEDRFIPAWAQKKSDTASVRPQFKQVTPYLKQRYNPGADVE